MMQRAGAVTLGDYHSRWQAPELTEQERRIVDDFHRLYYRYLHSRSGEGCDDRDSWLGYRVLKCPTDLFTYQEIMFDTKPDVVIETGTYHGGSALYLATLCGVLGRGRVITIDIGPVPGLALPNHPLIEYYYGYSQSPSTVKEITARLGRHERVMVILDSNHRKQHVLQEIAAYAPLVSRGCYLIVEDTNFNNHPILPGFGPGPLEAVREFLAQSDDFVVDYNREKHFLTFNPSGFLLRVRGG